jgi:hypothetical protein
MAVFTSLAIAAVGAVGQFQAQKKAAAAQKQQSALAAQAADESKKQAELAKRQADIQNARQLRASIRQSRIASGTLANVGGNTGAFESSSFAGGLSGLSSNVGANIGTAAQQGVIAENILASQVAQSNIAVASGVAEGQKAIAGAQAQQSQAIFGAGTTIFQAGGGFKRIFGA